VSVEDGPRHTELERRRERFYDAIGDGVALVFAAPEAVFGHDVSYRYRPDPDLHYLTGFPEPEAAAVLDGARRRFVLFVRPKDRTRETWEGRRAGPAGAVRRYGAAEAYPIGELAERLPDLIRGASRLFHALGVHAEADRLVAMTLAAFRREARHAQRGPNVVADTTDVLHEMRLVKEPGEIDLLARAAAIASLAHRDAMAAARPGAYEYELEAAVEARF
jgi:Xaa-Pro aminopeptidase